MLFITSLNKTLTENRPLGLPQIGKMGNVIAAQLVTGLMCLMSQFSQAQQDRMWCHRNKGLGWWWGGGHTRPCWDAAEGRNIWQDKKRDSVAFNAVRSFCECLPSLIQTPQSSPTAGCLMKQPIFILYRLKREWKQSADLKYVNSSFRKEWRGHSSKETPKKL